MSSGEIGYLAVVLGTFGIFGVTMLYASARQGFADQRAGRPEQMRKTAAAPAQQEMAFARAA
jgi:hypothetical protein